jgi:Rieske Fe-S protein
MPRAMEMPMTHEDTLPEDLPAQTASEPLQPTCPGRRAALGCALAFGVSAVLAEGAEAATATPKYYNAGLPKVFLLNKPRLVEFLHGQAAVYITRLSTTKWQCLWAGCTHENCLVSWQVNHARYYCPCHGASFARNGRVVQGPARQAMFKLPIKLIKGKVMVDLAPTGLV